MDNGTNKTDPDLMDVRISLEIRTKFEDYNLYHKNFALICKNIYIYYCI